MTTHSSITQLVRSLLTTGLVAMLVACGGSSSSDDTLEGSVPIATRGVITQLGSIWVTGCRYVAAPGGTYKSDDDDSASFDDYEVGQLVSIRGRRNDDGVSCVADEVSYEAEIEGTADVDGKINGIEIVQTPKTNNTAPGAPDPLNNGDRYEVSGIWIDDFTIEATFIKEDDDGGSGDTIDEIKGYVQVVNSESSFGVRDITFDMAGGVPHGVSVGNLVEVHFSLCNDIAPDIICTASEVELEDDIFDQAEGTEVEIEGAVDLDTTGCPPGVAEFKVDGVCIDSDSKPAEWMDGLIEFGDLVQGARVETEGHMVDSAPMDYMRADKVKGRGNRVRVTSIADNIDAGAGTFDLFFGAIQVTTMPGVTEYEMDGGTSFGDITEPDEVEVRGIRTGEKSMLALRIKSEAVDPDKHELRAEVDLDGADSGAGTIKVMGITSLGGPGTELEVDDTIYTQGLAMFLDLIDDDDIVTPSNGPRDVIEVKVDTTVNPYGAGEIEIEEEDD